MNNDSDNDAQSPYTEITLHSRPSAPPIQLTTWHALQSVTYLEELMLASYLRCADEVGWLDHTIYTGVDDWQNVTLYVRTASDQFLHFVHSLLLHLLQLLPNNTKHIVYYRQHNHLLHTFIIIIIIIVITIISFFLSMKFIYLWNLYSTTLW